LEYDKTADMIKQIITRIALPCAAAILSGLAFNCMAQENYEIQVYGSETVKPKTTMVELHSNVTMDGSRQPTDGVLPTNHEWHETIEITHGWTPWFETGFYFFNSVGNDGRTSYVGSHIRPRFAAPAKWNWPVGVSLSLEAGYQKREYSTDDWTLEIRPIIDKKLDKLYLSFNPTFDKSFHGQSVHQGYVFSPNFKASYFFTKLVAPGLEYYGSLGPLNGFFPKQDQQHQLFFVLDLDFSPVWEFNFGYGLGLTSSTDNSIVKLILGRRF